MIFSFDVQWLNEVYVFCFISCLEPLFISANWFMDVGHLMWWLESRCSLHKCWFPFSPALTYRYNTNSIDTQFKKVTVVTSCIDTLILSIDTKQSVSIHVPLYRYSWGFRPHGGYCQTMYWYSWGEYRYSSTGIDTYTLVSIHLRVMCIVSIHMFLVSILVLKIRFVMTQTYLNDLP